MSELYTAFIEAKPASQLTLALYLLGFAGVTLAFGLGILALLKPRDHQLKPGSFLARALGPLDLNFEQLNRQWIRIGFLLLACGLITGRTLAEPAWSVPWGWDPKSNWGLFSWLIYGAVLHLHYTPAFKGRKAVWASVFAWGLALLTYFGMSKLPPKNKSMHLYTEPPTTRESETAMGVDNQMHGQIQEQRF